MSGNSEHFEELGDRYFPDDPMRGIAFYIKALLEELRTRKSLERGLGLEGVA
jgi:hypothetical protein